MSSKKGQVTTEQSPNVSKSRSNKKTSTTPGTPQTPPAKRSEPVPADLTVLVTRTDMFDSLDSRCTLPDFPLEYPKPPVSEYQYAPDMPTNHSVAVCRLPNSLGNTMYFESPENIPNPLDDNLKKYWKQRTRLFHKFDDGIHLDAEGWYSVTPEQVADHVANRASELMSENNNAVVLDAFCGCGGNAIAFAKQKNIQTVVCVDVDREKLKCAAHNANIYGIPSHKLLFVNCNAIFVLEYCYKNSEFVLDQPIESPEKAQKLMAAMPPPTPTEIYQGYQIGGIDLLPRSISCLFMDPPWGGVDYSVFGREGYSLQSHMRIPRSIEKTSDNNNDFFDHFAPQNKQERKAIFNCEITDCVNGQELLEVAASACPNVVFDIPKNTSKTSLARAGLAAGYRGNCKLEEHYLNGRLKTVTAYFGKDWRSA